MRMLTMVKSCNSWDFIGAGTKRHRIAYMYIDHKDAAADLKEAWEHARLWNFRERTFYINLLLIAASLGLEMRQSLSWLFIWRDSELAYVECGHDGMV